MGPNKRCCSLLLAMTLMPLAVNVAAESFSDWKSRQQQQADQWLSEQQKAFADMLKSDWEEYVSRNSERQGYRPKPVKPPAVTPDVPRPAPPGPRPEKHPEPKKTDTPEPGAGALNFLGHKLSPPGWEAAIPEQYSGSDDFAQAWESLAKAPSTREMVDWLQSQREALNLGDWGTWKLTLAVSEGSPHQQSVRTWYLLLALGYDVKLGFNKQRVAVLPRVEQTIYWKQYYTSGGMRYYDLGQKTSSPDQLFLHGSSGEKQPLDLSFRQPPETVPAPRSIHLDHDGQSLKLEFDAQRAGFYQQHPTMDLVHYFEAPLDPLLQASLTRAWNALGVAESSDLEKLNLLLSLVQHGVAYQLDEDLFGIEEYYQLPAELLANGAGDCEDRSILFARLGKQLLKREIIGVRYPGHVATAIELQAPGISYLFGGSRYLVADPTYIGSQAGQAIPDLENEDPELIH